MLAEGLAASIHEPRPLHAGHAARYGWLCPRCGASNAPSVQRCQCAGAYIGPPPPLRIEPWTGSPTIVPGPRVVPFTVGDSISAEAQRFCSTTYEGTLMNGPSIH